MGTRPYESQAPSPLDASLRAFLGHVATLDGGFAPTTDAGSAATACGVPFPFIEALFTSARIRGLIEPFQPRGARGRYRWRVSARGERWRSEFEATS